MISIKATVTGASIGVEEDVLLTSGMVGAEVEFSFSDEWSGLSKTAVFRAATVNRVVNNVEEKAVIPWEVLEQENYPLQIGVYGCNEDGSVVIPTVWVSAGTIQPGTDPEAHPGMAPALPMWKQNELIAKEAMEVARSVRQDADAGAFAGPQGPQGIPGNTPVKGVDYWTQADRLQILQEVENSAVGDMEQALDYILSIQNTLTGGEGI